jgi:hypothetical protein
VEFLRSSGRRPVKIKQVGEAVCPGFKVSHTGWLNSILRALERDGLVTFSGNGLTNGPKVLLA